MKKILALLLAAVLVLGMAACAASPAAPTQTTSDTASDASDTPASNAETPAASSGAKLRFVTGGESGTYYAFGSVIAQHATNNAGVDIVGLVGNGSQSNIFELEDGNAELAFRPPAAPAPARQDGKASRPAGRDAIISVQGAGNSLWALARTAEGRIVSLRPGSPFACGRVSAVTRQGVRVRCQNSTLFISF